MNVRQYLFLFSFGTAIALASWLLILFMVDPHETGLPGILVFYITLSCALIGFFTTVGTIWRTIRKNEEGIEVTIARSLRQALLLTALFISVLILQSKDQLHTLTIFLLVGAFGFLEFLSLSIRRSK